MAVVLVVAMALPFLLPPRYSLFPQWLMPALLGALLVTLIIADPGRIDRRSELIRACSIALVVVLCLGAAFFTGSSSSSSSRVVGDQLRRLAAAGGRVAWVYLIIAFAFVYWEFDGGAPRPGRWLTPSSPTWPSRAAEPVGRPPGGDHSSSTTSTWASPMPPPSARPTSCRWRVGRS